MASWRHILKIFPRSAKISCSLPDVLRVEFVSPKCCSFHDAQVRLSQTFEFIIDF